MPRLLELSCGTKSIGRAFEAAGWEVVSPDIVLKFEPTILCDIRSWDYTLFSPGHFDMVWASPVCTEHSRALTMRPRRLEEGDALVLRALEIMAHFDPLMWVIENPATRLLKTRPFMERLPWVDVTHCKYGTPYRKQTEPRAMQERQPVRRVGGALKGGLGSWGVSVRGSGGSRASFFTAFLRRCARRLRARPRQSLRIGSRAEARGISYMSYFFREAW